MVMMEQPPYAVFVQAIDMANYERANHYIVRQDGSWLITPERPRDAGEFLTVRPQARAPRSTSERIGL